uniref:Cytochrome P450 monooxygenase n=1 Tax=Nodulisporium sp. TaxID=1897413 RepID=A0A2R4QEZ5_9PEZI|nr:cytochrome P450 monooxygenase [Nodulisporium sp.]
MRSFEPAMVEQVDIFIQQLGRLRDQPVDVKSRCSYLSFDIIGLLSFGYSLHLQTQQENRFLVEQLARSTHRMNVCMQIPVISRYKLHVYINKFFQQEREKTARLIETMIRSRMAEDVNAKRDLYSFVAEAVNAKDDEGLQLYIGGDTSATALSATLFYLSRNLKSYAKLAAEIRTTFQSADEICVSKLTGCQYLRACIDESLRMSPPSPGTLWRELAPEEEGGKPFVVDGHIIPHGTKYPVLLWPSPPRSSRDYLRVTTKQEYFHDPFTYNPDRWLETRDSKEGGTSRKAMHDAFAAFSIGSRGCAGKPMAYLELSLALAKTFWYFDFETAPGKLGDVGLGQKGEFHLYDIFTSTHDGPYLAFTARDSFLRDFGDAEGQD